MEQLSQGRWEWRTYGIDEEEAEHKIQTYPLKDLLNTQETGILARLWDANIKIHFNMLDVKTLQNVSDNGLQQWLPTRKMNFPLTSETISDFLEQCNVPVPIFGRHSYTSDQFLKEIIIPNEMMRSVIVRKRRQLYRIDDVAVEIANIEFNGVRLRTIGIEHEDPGKVWALLNQLNLQNLLNISQVSAVKRCLGMIRNTQKKQ